MQTSGALRGLETDGVRAFRGIRYARAPRLAPPEPVEAWDGTDAVTFGPACPQGSSATRGRAGFFGGLFGPGDVGIDEDCLFLNVFTPGRDDARRPVMVWIHGGAFTLGTGASPIYDGSGLARRGDVVVVTLNYRLGTFGFAYRPDLGAVNLGLQDQVAALRWVRDEIAGFGGDPDDVTIFGESAGAKSVECLLAMPSARGLFTRAILQSTYDPPMDVDGAAERTRRVEAELGTDLVRAPVDEVLEAQARAAATSGGALSGTGPVIDGTILPRAPIEVIASGDVAHVPMVIGTTADEFRLFAAMAGEVDDAALRARLEPLGIDVDAAAELYRRTLASRGLGSAPVDVLAAAMTDGMFRQHSIRLAEAQSAHRDTYMYLFTHPSPAFGGMLRACHALELPFVFGTLDAGLADIAGTGDDARAVSDQMQEAWLRFARHGDPEWPAYTTGARTTRVFGPGGPLVDAPLEDERLFWRRDGGI